MEKDGGGKGGAARDGGDKNQQQPQDRKAKAAMLKGEGEAQDQAQAPAQAQPEVQAPPPQLPQQPVQCPRCDSLNTKFCYYNNYSMSQPRYFCKTCRRYWTHGGTLRNVPVGGGCRKGRRGARNSPSSSAENSASSSRSNQPPPSQELGLVQAQPNPPPMVGARDPPSLGLVPSVTPFFQGGGLGGYLSSLGVGGIHHSTNQPHPFDQALMNVAGVGSNNLGVLSGFNNVGNSLGPLRPSHQYYQLGGGERDVVGSLYPPPAEQQQQGLLVPSTMSSMANSSAATHHHRDYWTHRFITNNNAANNIGAPDTSSMWSTVSTTTNISGNNNSRRNVAAAGSSSAASALIPNQWPNVPGFGPPPSPF